MGLIILAMFSIVQPTGLRWMENAHLVWGSSSEAEGGLAWLGQKGARRRGRPGPPLDERPGISSEGRGCFRHRPGSQTTWVQIPDLPCANFVTSASCLASLCLSFPIDKMGITIVMPHTAVRIL